ncbi:DUF5391 family protein [Rummeliibacillus pycnus]|uniref:DUF5391 family protein n=1 Tax=Rummeliibacillus pycnus TaxID=101070 RepID=UPI000C9B1796|nr:DUF5391 family protein [Rummeliibacillus pycnus]
MKTNKGITISTIFSAILFCVLIVVISLSPLSQLGKHANQFNSPGMWLAIINILSIYAIPLFLYLIGLEWMKFIMTFLCALGILIFTFLLLIVLVIGYSMHTISDLYSVIFVCSLAIITNVIWFFVAFNSKKNNSPSIA